MYMYLIRSSFGHLVSLNTIILFSPTLQILQLTNTFMLTAMTFFLQRPIVNLVPRFRRLCTSTVHAFNPSRPSPVADMTANTLRLCQITRFPLLSCPIRPLLSSHLCQSPDTKPSTRSHRTKPYSRERLFRNSILILQSIQVTFLLAIVSIPTLSGFTNLETNSVQEVTALS